MEEILAKLKASGMENTTFYFNGMHPDELRKYGFQMISYPLAIIISSIAGVIDLLNGKTTLSIATST